MTRRTEPVHIHDHTGLHQGGKLKGSALSGVGGVGEGTGGGSGSGSAGTPAATVEDETTFGISPAAGVSTTYSRGDHTHGTPAEPSVSGAIGPILITDTPAGSPLIFGDLLQTDEGDDLLYADI